MSVSLDDVSQLARDLLEAETAVKRAEDGLKLLKEKRRLLAEETIPAIMQELGIKDLTLESGQKMKLKQDVYAQIPKDEKQGVFNWLNEHGFGGLIKTEVAAEFGKGERESAIELAKRLSAEGFTAGFSEDVHAQTMKAFLLERVKKGDADFPFDLFHARPVWVATIK